MKIKPVYVLAAFSLFLGAAIPLAIANPAFDTYFAQATEKRSEQGRFRGGHRQKLLESLDLTPDQMQQFETIHGDKSQMREKYDLLKSEMDTLRDLVRNSASTSDLRSQHQKIQALRQEVGSVRFEKMLAMYELLTPDQRKTVADKMKLRHGRKGHFGGRQSHRGQSGEFQSLLMF